MKIALIVSGNADQLRALPAGLPENLAGVDSKPFCQVVLSQDDAMAGFFVTSHSDRFVFQSGII